MTEGEQRLGDYICRQISEMPEEKCRRLIHGLLGIITSDLSIVGCAESELENATEHTKADTRLAINWINELDGMADLLLGEEG